MDINDKITPEENIINDSDDSVEASLELEEVIEPDDEPIAPPPKKKLPLFCKIIYAISALCAVLYAAFVLSPEFSDFFNNFISMNWCHDII